MLATSLVADVRVSSPKISQQDSGTYTIEMLIEGSQRIQDTDFQLFEYKSNNPLTNEFITSIILEDLNSFQRLSINLADSYTVDYFAYRLNILNSFNKDILSSCLTTRSKQQDKPCYLKILLFHLLRKGCP